MHLVIQEQSDFIDGKKVSFETLKTLSFDIDGKVGDDEYLFLLILMSTFLEEKLG